jgi:hypothetical protein
MEHNDLSWGKGKKVKVKFVEDSVISIDKKKKSLSKTIEFSGSVYRKCDINCVESKVEHFTMFDKSISYKFKVTVLGQQIECKFDSVNEADKKHKEIIEALENTGGNK